jgi:class 3 adenylate cyclase
MGLKDDLQSDVKDIFATRWSSRKGDVVPEADDVGLDNDAVKFDEAAILYADLAESTTLVNEHSDSFAAEVYKAFLHCASKIVRQKDGEITAFDGDRIMAVFLGDHKRTNAAKCGLQINYAVKQIINPAIKGQYPNSTYALAHAVGVDLSEAFVARTGIRGSNDLVWVGRAANYAAKLATLREGDFATWITADVYNKMNDSSKEGGNPKRNMWEQRTWTKLPGVSLYRSHWRWSV